MYSEEQIWYNMVKQYATENGQELVIRQDSKTGQEGAAYGSTLSN